MSYNKKTSSLFTMYFDSHLYRQVSHTQYQSETKVLDTDIMIDEEKGIRTDKRKSISPTFMGKYFLQLRLYFKNGYILKCLISIVVVMKRIPNFY